jgi:hypothetical protein
MLSTETSSTFIPKLLLVWDELSIKESFILKIERKALITNKRCFEVVFPPDISILLSHSELDRLGEM